MEVDVKKTEMRALLYSRLAEVFGGMGFRVVKSQEGLVRKTPTGTQRISIPFYDYEPLFKYSLLVEHRLDVVEDIYKRFCGFDVGDETTFTVATPLEFFTGQRDPNVQVVTEDDLDESLRQLSPVIEARIKPFLDAVIDANELDQEMHASPTRLKTLDDVLSVGIRGVTVAWLAGNPHFEDLVNDYRQNLRMLGADEHLNKFDECVNYLRNARKVIG